MGEPGPPLFTGGARRRRFGRARRRGPERRRPRFRPGLLLIPVAGAAALTAIVLASSGSDHHGDGGHAQRAPSLAQPAKPPPSDPEAGGGDPSHFAVRLSGPSLVHLRFSHSPRAGLLFDVRSGRVLWQLDPTRRLPIASLTKMM